MEYYAMLCYGLFFGLGYFTFFYLWFTCIYNYMRVLEDKLDRKPSSPMTFAEYQVLIDQLNHSCRIIENGMKLFNSPKQSMKPRKTKSEK